MSSQGSDMRRKGILALILILAGSFLACSDALAFPVGMTGAELGAQVEQQLTSRNFDWLDETARQLRNPDIRLIGGNSQLYHFYAALGSYADAALFGYTSQIAFNPKRQLLEQWLSAKPQSLSAHIALAQLWLNYAWTSRGDGFADKVSTEQWRALASGLEKAASYCKTLNDRSDPHAYFVLMDIARGQENPRPVLDELYAAAIQLYPTYFHYYSQRANNLQERWYGRQGELQTYAESLLHSPGGDAGLVAYSYVAFNLMQFNDRSTLYESTGLTWPLVRSAYSAREQRYGLRNRDWNALCNLAVAALDRPAAKQALSRIGDNWDVAVWKERKYFDITVAWILMRPEN
jgi:hypothetical protein